MDLLRETLTCKICNNILNTPIYLPCQKTLCKSHLDEKINSNNNNSNRIKCFFCESDHEVPAEGFQLSEIVNNFIKLNSYLNEPEKQLKQELDSSYAELSKIYEEFKVRAPEFELTTREYFSYIQAGINFHRDKVKSQVDQIADEMLAQTNECRDGFLKKMISIKNNPKIIKQDHLARLKKDLDDKFRNPKLDIKDLDDLKLDLESNLNVLKKSLKKYSKLQAKIETCQFKPSDSIIQDSQVGQLKLINGYKIITGLFDKTIKLYDVNTGQCEKTLKGHGSIVFSIELMSEHELASGSADKTIKVWNLKSGQCIQTLRGHEFDVLCLRKMPLNLLASGSGDTTIKIWSLDKSVCIKTLYGHQDCVNYLDVLPDGNLLSCSTDKTIKMWDLENGECVMTLKEHRGAVFCLQIISNELIASGSADETIKIWSLNIGECVQTLKGHKGAIRNLLLKETNVLASGSFDNTIKIWDISSGECLRTLEGHTDNVRCIRMLPNKTLMSGSWDGTIKLWNLNRDSVTTLTNDLVWVTSVQILDKY